MKIWAYIALFLIIVGVCALQLGVLFPSGGRSENDYAAVGALRTLNTAQALYLQGNTAASPPTRYAPGLADLHAPRALIDSVMAGGAKQGFTYRILQADATHWSAVAEPQTPGRSGFRWYYIDETGVIRVSLNGPATAASPPL